MIEPGQQAHDFELPDQDGRAVKLSDFRGQPVVLYFYPKADTPGCNRSTRRIHDLVKEDLQERYGFRSRPRRSVAGVTRGSAARAAAIRSAP
jgi:peroxiredoxin